MSKDLKTYYCRGEGDSDHLVVLAVTAEAAAYNYSNGGFPTTGVEGWKPRTYNILVSNQDLSEIVVFRIDERREQGNWMNIEAKTKAVFTFCR